MIAVKPEPLTYTVWMLFDQKASAVFLLFTAVVISVFVWFKAESLLWAFSVFTLLLLSLLPLFLPVYYELNTDGISFKTFFRKRRIFWDGIYRYKVRQTGVLLFSQREHFALEAFNGLFLPVPEDLMPEIIYRLRFFVDKLPE